ncbi:MAG: hypothetical protein ACPL25_07810, partial [Ignavibacteria bacterium]
KILFLIVYLSVLVLDTMGQSNEQANVQVQASLKKGITINVESNVLDFGEILLSNSQQTINKPPEQGLKFRIVSHPDKPVLIDFNNIILVNNNYQNGPIFIPRIVHTGLNSGYVNPVEVQPGIYYQPENQEGEGILNIWVGGTLEINQSVLHGDYTGIMEITIAY